MSAMAVAPPYVELHCHSAYSFLDGVSLPDELAARAHELGYEALALTDHNSVSGSMELALSAEQYGLRLLVGSDDSAKVYLNGKLVHKAPFGRGFVADQDRVPDIALNAGLNVLVFKVVNENDNWMGSIRFTDAQGNPVKGIKVTLDPEAKDLP